MKTSRTLSQSLFASVAAAALLALALPAHAANMTRTDYTASKSRIGDAYKVDKKACDSQSANAKDQTKVAVAKEKCDDQSGNDKDVCVKAAKAIEVRGLADAKMGKKIDEAKSDAAQSKTDADYKLAAEKCDAIAGDAKTSCMNAAKSRFGKT